MLIGYMRVSKADGSQVLDLQRDALIGGGVSSDHLYEDHASGKRDDRPGLDACLKSLRKGDTLVAWKLDRIGRDLKMTTAKLRLAQAAMSQPGTKIGELCIELGVSRQTLYRHMTPMGQLRPDGERLLGRKRGVLVSGLVA